MDEQKPKRTYNRKWDTTPSQTKEERNKRTRRREDRITQKAIEFGFKSKSDMLTAIIEGKANVIKL